MAVGLVRTPGGIGSVITVEMKIMFVLSGVPPGGGGFIPLCLGFACFSFVLVTV